MQISQLKWLIREQIRSIKENNAPVPSKPKDKPQVHPGTPEKPKKRRPLTPPKDAPNTRPKAESNCKCGGEVNENEQEIVNKITQRFKSKK